MRSETLNGLICARILFDKAQELCLVDDKHIASAGLVILQDALELIFYSVLLELGVDKQKRIDNLNFDQEMAEIEKAQVGSRAITVADSSTLRTLNKQRVITKHRGRPAEPGTVREYFHAAQSSADHLLVQVLGKNLQDVILDELIRGDDVKRHIGEAARAIEEGQYFAALVEVRKAIFLEVEADYSVEGWEDAPADQSVGLAEIWERGGLKAPDYTKNKEWITENVSTPFDYVQINRNELRLDLVEWGVNTQDFLNLTRLTPPVFYFSGKETWAVKTEAGFVSSAATESNARFCLDRAVSLILKKQMHSGSARFVRGRGTHFLRVRLKTDQEVYRRASPHSATVGSLRQGSVCHGSSVVGGLDGCGTFVSVFCSQAEGQQYVHGYIPSDSCEIEEIEKQ